MKNTKRIAKEIVSDLAPKDKYKERFDSISKKISDLQKKLKKHKDEFTRDNLNWGFVGDLGHVDEVLGELSDFMKG